MFRADLSRWVGVGAYVSDKTGVAEGVARTAVAAATPPYGPGNRFPGRAPFRICSGGLAAEGRGDRSHWAGPLVATLPRGQFR